MRCRGEPAAGCSAADEGGTVCALDVDRRAAAADQRAEGRYGADRASSAAAAVPAAVLARADASPRGAARHQRLGTVPRAQCHQLDGEVQAGCVVCGPLHAVDRHPSDLHHHQERADAERHQLRHGCDDGGV